VGIILTDENGIQEIRKRLYLTFSKEDVDWYFAGMLPEEVGGEFDLGRSVIVRDEELGTYCVPLFSLQMLAISTMKWMKDADLGRALNVKGGIVEEYFFRFLHSYNISLNSPKTGKPMLRVRNPNNSALEIADIMGYDGKRVLVLETKFWNAPTLGELEEELGKFDRNLSFIKTNLKEFGFNEKSEVIPIFYTPYAPYPLWHGISVVPSVLSLGLKVGRIFGIKKVELYRGSSGLEKLLELIKDPLPYPIDGSELVRDLEFNKYRLHDGLVAEYDEEEITVFIDMPESMCGFFACFDIDPETFRKLRKNDVLPGDIIRMITVNLSGSWSQTQLLTFKKILRKAEWESDTIKALPYSKMIYLFKGT
jgi:hypothetical protein